MRLNHVLNNMYTRIRTIYENKKKIMYQFSRNGSQNWLAFMARK